MNIKRYRFALPSVKEGSVIDVKYTMVGFPSTFEFQKSIPVDYVELILPQSQYIKFKQYAMGFQTINKKSDIEWYSEKVPALKKEPYTSTLDNYVTQFQFDIIRITFPGYPYKSIASDWNSVANYLRKDEEFGRRLKTACMFLNEKAKEIVAKDTPSHKKMIEAFEHIKNHMTWNERKDVMASKDLRFAFNEGKGDVSEINLMLVKMLEKVGLNAFPIVASTRDNGYLHPFFASLEKLNYVLAGVEIGNETIILDATDKLLPAGILPKRAYNGQARVIKEEETGPIDIIAEPYETHTTYNLDLNEDGSFKGTISEIYKSNAAYNFRKHYHSLGSKEEFIKEITSENTGLQINNLEVKNLDNLYEDVEIVTDVVINNQTQVVGDEIYFNPMLFEKLEKNPFQKENRKYPIDFTYPIHNNYYLMLNLPAGYTIKTAPKPAITRLPENGGQYFYNIANMSSRIQLSFMQKQTKTVYTDAFYPYLKEFYKRVVEKSAEFIVLTKTANE
jgi:hypothetical protein